MEEENKNLEPQSENEVSTEEQQAPASGMPDRSCILLILAGLYLIYTGYRLCKNVLEGVEGGSVGFFVAGAAFVLIGAGMTLWGAKNALKNDNIRKAAQAAEERVQAIKEYEPPKEENPSMSISERAKLTERLEDEEEKQPEE